MKNRSRSRITSELKPIAKVLNKLSGVKELRDGFLALCPSHDDQNPSLKISEGRDGRALIHCHAGCKFDSVLNAIGLQPHDLFLENKREIVAVYKYRDENGKVVYEIVRTNPKGFYARRNVGGKTIKNLKGAKKVPYNLPEVIDAVENNRLVIIVEGEKDADNLLKLGLTATTFAFGLKWEDTYSQYFHDARVVIIPDNDKVGKDKSLNVAKQLYPVVKTLRLVFLPNLPPKGDISDWLHNGGSKAALLKNIKETALWEPLAEVEISDIEMNINSKVAEYNEKYATVLYKKDFLVVDLDNYDPSLNRNSIQFIALLAPIEN
jgi:putative DNA primase/helicase